MAKRVVRLKEIALSDTKGLGSELALAMFYRDHEGLELLVQKLGVDTVLGLMATIGGSTIKIPSPDAISNYLTIGSAAVRCVNGADPVETAQVEGLDLQKLSELIGYLRRWCAKKRRDT